MKSSRFAPVLSMLVFTSSIVTIATPTHAQGISGIFGTRSSEQFFLEGLERLAEEVDVLQDSADSQTDLLTIDSSIEEQRQMIEQESLTQDASSSGDERLSHTDP